MKVSSAKLICINKVFILAVAITAFAGISKSYGQSVIGKWKQLTGKTFMTPEAVKNSHGHLQDVMDMTKIDAIDEFKSDHTLIQTVTSGSVKSNTSGTWTMSGRTVTISVQGHPAMTGVVSDTDNILTYTVEMPKAEHMQVFKREWTYSRI